MRPLINTLLPYIVHGLGLRIDKDTVYASGLREDIDIKTLEKEITSNWLEMVRQEALLIVRDKKEETVNQLRPKNFMDLVIKLHLGRIKPEEQKLLNDYYDKLEEIEQEAENLTNIIKNANVSEINNINWPEWITWKEVPENPKFVFCLDKKQEKIQNKTQNIVKDEGQDTIQNKLQ